MGSLGTSPVMVGREAELRALRAVFAAGAAGVPRVALVSGEAGIGKTRLVTEFLEEIAAAPQDPPVVVAIGPCVEMGEIGAPFTPIRRMLRELYTAVGDEEFRHAAGTALVIKTLGTLVPDLAPDAEIAVDVAPQFITEAIERVITALGTTRHLVLVLEDLHWADSATLALLKDLNITLRTAHVTTLMTYRTDDVGHDHPLRPLLVDLQRSRAVVAVPLTRLEMSDAELVARMVRADLDSDEASTVAARSEGVPFLIEELAQWAHESRRSGQAGSLRGGGRGEDASAPLPDTLRDIVLARYERLSPVAAAVVMTAAVGGVHVDDDLIAEVFAGDASELRGGLHEAIDASVLVADRDGYRFRHALIQEAVHDDLLPGERVDLHARYAAVLERRVSGGHREDAAELAEHWLEARNIPNALDATLVARAYAIDTPAPIAAAALGERLLDLWPQVPGAQSHVRMSRAALALEIAQAYEDGGDRERALRAAEAGVEFAEPDETLLRASLLYEVASRLRSSGRRPQASEVLLAARGLLDAESSAAAEQALLARIDAMRVQIDPRLGSTAPEVIDQAVELAERSGDNGALALALFARADWIGDRGDLRRAEADLRRVADLPADVRTHLQVMVNLTGHLLTIGAYHEALELGRRAVDEAVLAGQERGLGAFLALNLAETEIDLGDIESGLAHAESVLPFLPSSPYFQSCVLHVLGMATLWDDRIDRSREYRAREREVVADKGIDQSVKFRLLLDGYAALAESAPNQRIAGADGLAGRILTVLDWELPGLTEDLVPVAAWLAAREASVRGILRPAIDRALTLPDAGPPSSAWKAVARAFTDGTVAVWREALERAEEGRIPNRYVHLARFRLAETLLADGERGEASALLDRVIAEAPADGASLVGRWAGDLMTRAGLGTQDAAAPPTTAAPGVSSLTHRELQVLALVAEGLTNPQIGERLYISPKTASVHVSAILAKTGAANRAEAAALYAAASV